MLSINLSRLRTGIRLSCISSPEPFESEHPTFLSYTRHRFGALTFAITIYFTHICKNFWYQVRKTYINTFFTHCETLQRCSFKNPSLYSLKRVIQSHVTTYQAFCASNMATKDPAKWKYQAFLTSNRPASHCGHLCLIPCMQVQSKC